MSGHVRPERPVTFSRNQWSRWSGIRTIFETDFLNCSYGARPDRNAHQALDEVDRLIFGRSITHVLELDIVSYFDAIVRKVLMEMIERRISDRSLLRLI